MKKKAVNKKTWVIIGVAVVLLAVLGIGGYVISQGSAGREENMLELGKRYLDELNYEQAVVCFEAYLEIDPQSVEAYLGLAEAYEGLQNYEKALMVLAEGYAVTGDARLQESSSRLQDWYGEILAAEGNSGSDPQDTSDLLSEDHGSSLQEILVLDSTYESYGSAYGGCIPVKRNGMWGAINYNSEVIVPFGYTGLYASPDELGNFVLYNSVFTEQTFTDPDVGEIKYTIESREYFLFDNQGNALYQGEDEVRASGGMYITLHQGDGSALISYHSLDGTVAASWECMPREIIMNGFYDGISNLYDSLNVNSYVQQSGSEVIRHEDNVIPRIGTVDLQGNLSWREDPYYYIWWDEMNERIIERQAVLAESNFAVVSSVSTTVFQGQPVRSTMNHGYYITTIPYTDDSVLNIYDAESNRVAVVNCKEISIGEDGTVNIDEGSYNWSNGYRGFWVDGFTLWNYGSKMVFVVDDKNVLADLARNTGGGDSVSTDVVTAVYDYIAMADENYWLVQSGEQWGYIDQDGNEMALFEDAGGFVGGYALVKEDGEVWLINEEFQKLESLGQADSVAAFGELYRVTIGDQLHLYQLR